MKVSTFDWKLSGLPGAPGHQPEGREGRRRPPTSRRPRSSEAVRDADILVTQFCPASAGLIAAAERLKVVGVLRAGYENVDVAAATARGILVLNTPGRNADAVADFAVGMLLAEARNIARGHAGLKEGRWIREYPNSGKIPDMPGQDGRHRRPRGNRAQGRQAACRVRHVEILAYDPFVKEPPAGVRMVDLPELMAGVGLRHGPREAHQGDRGHDRLASSSADEEDVLPRQHFAFGARRREGPVRGPRDGTIAARPSTSSTRAARGGLSARAPDNVTVTPHMAGGSNDAFYNCPKLLAAELAKLLSGRRAQVGGEPRGPGHGAGPAEAVGRWADPATSASTAASRP